MPARSHSFVVKLVMQTWETNLDWRNISTSLVFVWRIFFALLKSHGFSGSSRVSSLSAFGSQDPVWFLPVGDNTAALLFRTLSVSSGEANAPCVLDFPSGPGYSSLPF